MKWYPLSALQWIVLLVLVAIADVFTIAQKYFVPEVLRPWMYLVFVVVVLFIFFWFVRPEKPMELAKTLCIVLTVITLVLVLVQDVIISYLVSWRTIIVVLGPVIGPWIAGYFYVKYQGT